MHVSVVYRVSDYLIVYGALFCSEELWLSVGLLMINDNIILKTTIFKMFATLLLTETTTITTINKQTKKHILSLKDHMYINKHTGLTL